MTKLSSNLIYLQACPVRTCVPLVVLVIIVIWQLKYQKVSNFNVYKMLRLMKIYINNDHYVWLSIKFVSSFCFTLFLNFRKSLSNAGAYFWNIKNVESKAIRSDRTEPNFRSKPLYETESNLKKFSKNLQYQHFNPYLIYQMHKDDYFTVTFNNFEVNFIFGADETIKPKT